jgi:nitroimidazol reductase NimA-like FMN-containing flavoprotein (pyridoxamine 5'-phosphate oxidase superfamily)
MKEEILNLADDLFLEDESAKREAFIKEFESVVALIREDDWEQFYAFEDIIMQKYF